MGCIVMILLIGLVLGEQWRLAFALVVLCLIANLLDRKRGGTGFDEDK